MLLFLCRSECRYKHIGAVISFLAIGERGKRLRCPTAGIVRSSHAVMASSSPPNSPAATSGEAASPGSAHAQRLHALDVARCVAMLLMMQGHVLDALVRTSELDTAVQPWSTWHAIRGITAPIFLMVSGIVHVFAVKRDERGYMRQDLVERRLRWAFTIIGLGYLLVFPANRVFDLPFVPADAWKMSTAVNILQLTGVTLILFVVAMQHATSARQMGRRAIVLAASILAAAPLATMIPWTAVVPLWVAAYFTTATGSLFPVVPWSAYLFLGVAIGAYLHGTPAERRLAVVRTGAFFAGAAAVAAAFLLQYGAGMVGISADAIESPMSSILVIRRTGYVLMIFSVSAVLTSILPSWLRSFAVTLSGKSLWIYAVHLVLLFGTPWFNGVGRMYFRSLSLQQGLVGVVVISTLTVGVAKLVDLAQRRPWPLSIKRWWSGLLIAVLMYLLFV